MSATAESQREQMDKSGATEAHPQAALAWCEGCGFEWHGRISVDGLRVIGHCPRCNGTVRFRDDPASAGRLEDRQPQGDVQPWQVLGTPSSWDR